MQKVQGPFPADLLSSLVALYKKRRKRDPVPATAAHLGALEQHLKGQVPLELVQLYSVIDGFFSETSVNLFWIRSTGGSSAILKSMKERSWPRQDWVCFAASFRYDIFSILAEKRFGEKRPIGLIDAVDKHLMYVVASSLAKFIELWMNLGFVDSDDWHRDKKAVLKIDPDLTKITAYPKAWELDKS
jgi:hypothetical protein